MYQYKENELDNQVLKCTNCKWEGKGSDAILIDFYGVSKVIEIHCPNCDKKIGEVQTDDSAGYDTGDQICNQLG